MSSMLEMSEIVGSPLFSGFSDQVHGNAVQEVIPCAIQLEEVMVKTKSFCLLILPNECTRTGNWRPTFSRSSLGL